MQSYLFFFFFFFLFNMEASPVNLTKFLTLSLEQQTSGLKSTKFLVQQECLHVVDCDLFSAELCFRAMG